MTRKIPLTEKYRPQKLSEILGQEHITTPLSKIVDAVKTGERDLPHMLFIGPAGTGKTTTAYALARELGWDIVELNASDERGIDVIRGKVKMMAFSRGKKIILLDEADALTEDAQQALRRIMEKATDARFILTANFEWKIIDPIKSRCAIFRFRRIPEDKIIRRLVEILRAEGVKIKKDQLETTRQALRAIVQVSGGDLRKAINLLEEIIGNKIDLTPEAISAFIAPVRVGEIFSYARQGELEKAIRTLEDILIDNKLDVQMTVEQFYNVIKDSMDIPLELKAEFYNALARAEHALKLGASPLIQLAALVSFIWMKFMSRGGESIVG